MRFRPFTGHVRDWTQAVGRRIRRCGLERSQFRAGVALLVVAGAVPFVPTALGAFTQASAALAVLNLADGAVPVGAAAGGRPVCWRASPRAAIGDKYLGVDTRYMEDETQLWGGAGLITIGGVILFAPLVLNLTYTTLLLSAAVLVLAAGALLIGLSRRGRAV